MKRLIVVAALSLSLSGCVGLAAGVANIAATVTSSTPQQVTTLGDAIQASTLLTRAVDLAVNTGKLPKPVLLEINALSDGLHAALISLESDNAAGKNLDFAAFNAALKAYNAYLTANAIAH